MRLQLSSLLLACLVIVTCSGKDLKSEQSQFEDAPTSREILYREAAISPSTVESDDAKTVSEFLKVFWMTATESVAVPEHDFLQAQLGNDRGGEERLQKRSETDDGSASGDPGSSLGGLNNPLPEYPSEDNPMLSSGLQLGDIFTSPSSFHSFLSRVVTNGVSSECSEGWADLFNTTDNSGCSNGLKAIDAFGKVGAGYLQGNTYALGSYDECFSLSSTQYCLADLVVETQIIPIDPHLQYALCLPQSCSESDIHQSINSTNLRLKRFNLSLRLDSVNCESESKPPYNAGAIVMLLVWSLFAVMVLGATIIHMTLRNIEKQKSSNILEEDTEQATENSTQPKSKKSPANAALEFVLSFSLFKTVPTMLSTKQQSQAVITCLNGIRVISMSWIIISHTHLWSFFIYSNQVTLVKHMASRFSFMPVPGGVLGVDSFLLMSGLLVTYLTMRQMNKQKGRFPLLMYYIHRILRITPAYIFVLFSYWLLTVHFADGPLWRETIGDGSAFYESCERYWWTNLLYINNIYPLKHIDICMPWTWYLANDMQFYVIAPLMIVPLYMFYPVGLAVVGMLLTVNLATLGGITGGYGISTGVAKFDELSQSFSEEGPLEHNITDDIYTKPWTRIGPYLIGTLLGFVLFKQLKPNFRKPFNHVFYISLWMLAFVLCSSTVYGLYKTFNGEPLNEAEDVSYQMFSRLTWSLGVTIVIFACHNGYGWIVNDFLSMKLWIPLSRLTFVTYLVHGIVLFMLLFTRREPFYGTDITITSYTIAAIVLSFSVAAIISAFVELPLSNVEVAVFKLVGLGGRESVRRAKHEEAEDCEVKRNNFFEENENENGGGTREGEKMEKREEGGEEGGGGRGGGEDGEEGGGGRGGGECGRRGE